MKDLFTLTVGHKDADFTGNTNEVIQAAVDRVAAVGRGIVKILPGRYVMKDSLHLRSGVTIEGSGSETVLCKAASIEAPLSRTLGYGHFDVSVAEPERFEIGMGIRISDDCSYGFYNTVATIIGKHGNELVIDRMLNHDYVVQRNSRIVSVYPVVSGYYVENACICNLTIDGNASENEFIDGCRGGGIFLLQTRNLTVSGVTVRNYNGDAISFQQGINTLIEDCCCVDNTGKGLHPGSGSVGVVMRNTISKNNGGEGLYYCLRVSHSLCEGCTFEGNKGRGISIGYRDTNAIITNNTITGNGGSGIFFREDELCETGCRTIITRNSISNNCRFGDKSEVFFESEAKDVYIYGNNGIADKDIGAACENYQKGVGHSEPEIDIQAGPDFVNTTSGLHLGVQDKRLFCLK